MFEEYAGSSPNFVSWKDKLHGQAPKANHIFFTPGWTGVAKWAAGNYFEIIGTEVIDLPITRTIPKSDYIELDLSNTDVTNSVNIYPEVTGQVHEILIGLHSGNYIVQLASPSSKPIGDLPDSTMVQSHNSSDSNFATNKYINAKNPTESPTGNQTLKFWVIKDMDAVVLRLMTLNGKPYEKITIDFKIARHNLKNVPANLNNADGNPFATSYDTIPFIRKDWNW